MYEIINCQCDGTSTIKIVLHLYINRLVQQMSFRVELIVSNIYIPRPTQKLRCALDQRCHLMCCVLVKLTQLVVSCSLPQEKRPINNEYKMNYVNYQS